MPKLQHMREILSGPLSGAYLESKASEGWKPVAVIWEREVPDDTPPLADIAQPVPYGLKIAEDCVGLEQDMREREALLVMLEMIIQDKPLSETAEELNRRGFRTRLNSKWTPGSVFDMLPRLIEVGPRVFSTQEWVVRRGKLMNVS
jgi:hypothetical protein